MTDQIVAHFAGEAGHRQEFLTHGYTIIPDSIPEPMLDALMAVIQRMEREVQPTPTASKQHIAGNTFRVQNLLNKDPIFQQVVDYDPVIAFAESILGHGMLLQTAVTLCVQPGATRQPIHTDDIYIDAPRPHPAFICNTIWALDDFTIENGATRVVPGTHRESAPPRPTLAEMAADPLEIEGVPAVMKRGSILAIDGSVWHGAGANLTDRRRAGLAVSYCKGWMRQQENFQLAVSLEMARTFSRRLRQLCGFDLYQNVIGNIDGLAPEQHFKLGAGAA